MFRKLSYLLPKHDKPPRLIKYLSCSYGGKMNTLGTDIILISVSFNIIFPPLSVNSL